MATYYSFDNTISAFFVINTAATRKQCDAFAFSRAGGQVHPVQIQGTFSYTVTAGTDKSKIFQFRIQDSSIDMEIMNLAKTVHPQLVAGCKYHGTIGDSKPVHVYEMGNIPGAAYIISRNTSVPQPPDSVSRQRRTVKDLARRAQTMLIARKESALIA
ncbi:mus38-like protein [Colletotrichum higginsianum]|nr:mus38-like protein [Colletotrichum higginsianum]